MSVADVPDEERVMDMDRLISLFRDEKGATAIEYGLIAGLIAVVIIVAVGLVGDDVEAVFTGISSGLENAGVGDGA